MDENGKIQRTAIIGGTFNAMHQGHQDYIKLAFEFADEVFILLTTDKYAKSCKKYPVSPYEIRKSCLENYIHAVNGSKPYHIFEMISECTLIRFCTEREITMAIIIPEYYPLFQKINHLREDEGKLPLVLIIKERTKTSEGFKLSSTLINNLKCDQRLSPKQYSPELAAYTESLNFSINQPNTVPK